MESDLDSAGKPKSTQIRTWDVTLQDGDIFALGVLLYFFSTGVRPFGDPKGKRRLHQRLWRDPVPPRKRRADFPPWRA